MYPGDLAKILFNNGHVQGHLDSWIFIKHSTFILNQNSVKILNLWIVLPTKYTKLNVQQIKMILKYNAPIGYTILKLTIVVVKVNISNSSNGETKPWPGAVAV